MSDSSANPRNYGERPLHEDDPLMELSRIMDFGTPADDNVASNEHRPGRFEDNRREPDFDPSLDLERELLGSFDDYSQPSGEAQIPATPSHDDSYREPHALVQEDELVSALEEEFDLEMDNSGEQAAAFEPPMFEEVDRTEPVPQFEYNDYSAARDAADEAHAASPSAYGRRETVEEIYIDANDDPAILQLASEPRDDYRGAPDHDWNVQAAEPAAPTFAVPPAQQPLSLEDELENLLFSEDSRPASQIEPEVDGLHLDDLEIDDAGLDEQYAPASAPVAPAYTQEQHAAPAGYPYYARGNFSPDVAGQAALEQAPQPDHAPAAASFAVDEPEDNADDFSFEDDFSFDLDEPKAAIAAEGTDDDLAELDDIGLSEDDFFTGDELDLGAEAGQEAPAYAHAVRSEDNYRSSPVPFQPFGSAHSAVSAPAPEVETLSVAEEKVEQTHSLDLPEVNYGEEESGAAFTDLEAEFAEVFNTVGVDDGTKSDAQSEADRAFEDIFRESASSYLPNAGTDLGAAVGAAAVGLGAASAAGAYGRSQASAQTKASGPLGNEDDFYNHWAAQGAQTVEGGDYGERAAMQAEDDLGSAADAYRNRPVRGRRGLILASVAGAAVLLGGIGYHFLGGGSSSEPVVIRADTQPIKVQPENPGGATVPNQDKAVYDRVAGTLPNNPEQKSLITSGEEPVDLSGTDDSENMADNAPEEPVVANNAPANNQDANQNAPLIQPREVETMIVRPDGSIVPSAPAPQESAPQPSPAAESQPAAPANGGDEIGALVAGNAPAEPVAPAPTPAPQAQQPQPVAEAPRLPVRAPVVPSRPAEQPVNIVGNVPQRTQQVASAAGAGGYFIQIASQPSAELAQKSYTNMAQKYGSVIGGRSVDIKRADIPGKGTYYRVRVQGGSKDEATALCGRLKSAGGSCFVTQ